MPARRRTVVTGMGAVTPVGLTADETWQALRDGRSGVGPITRFDATTFPCRIAAQVPADLDAEPPSGVDPVGPEGFPLSETSRFALRAADEAWRAAGLDAGGAEPARTGVSMGSGKGVFDLGPFAAAVAAGRAGGPSGGSSGGGAPDSGPGDRLSVPDFMRAAADDPRFGSLAEEPFDRPAEHMARMLGTAGPVCTTITSCAAGTQAIGEGMLWIREGRADVVVAGGAHFMVDPIGVMGFSLLTALSTRNDEPERASRPFDLDRDGFVMGEGAACLVLEEREHALARGAEILGEIVGYGNTFDAHRATDPAPDGRGMIGAMGAALADARIEPDEVGYVNAHGTSTPQNDEVETMSLRRVFGDHADRLAVSSIKSMVGHGIAASGAIETIATVLALRDGVLPPTINLETPDPRCDLDCVPGEARESAARMALKNSFGFGGQNSCLVIGAA